MLFRSLLDEIPQPTTFEAGDRVVVTRQNPFKPNVITIQVARYVSREQYYAMTRYMPQGRKWPMRIPLLIGDSPGTTESRVRLLLDGIRSMTDQITAELCRIDPSVKEWKWRRIGFQRRIFLRSAEFVAEYPSSG